MTDENGDDGDRLLDAIGIVLVLAVGFGIVVVVLAAANAPTGPPDDAPSAEWSVTRVNETHVRIEHAGGDPVPAPELLVIVNGLRRSTGWSGTVEEGDVGVVRAEPDDRVQLYWTGGAPDERVLLGRWRVS